MPHSVACAIEIVKTTVSKVVKSIETANFDCIVSLEVEFNKLSSFIVGLQYQAPWVFRVAGDKDVLETRSND